MHWMKNFQVTGLLLMLTMTQVWSAGAEENAATSAPTTTIVVERPGHLGRQTGDLERILHFYHDLLGLDLRGERDADRPFWTSKPLIEFADVPPEAEFRAVILPIQGTATEPGAGREMTIEAIEYRNVERRHYEFRLQDRGVSWLRLFLRELDPALARLREAGVTVVTEGGEALSFAQGHGSGRAERAIIVRDPDGYPVELVEQSPGQDSSASSADNIAGAQVVVVVADIEATLAFYRQLIGTDLEIHAGSAFITDPDLNRLRDTPGARSRSAFLPVPGSPVMMEFVQYDNIEQQAIRPEFWDLGVGHMLFMVSDLDAIMARIRAAGLRILARSGEPVYLNPQVRAVFTRDPDSFFVEFMERKEATPAAE